jgi:hypothetical protein
VTTEIVTALGVPSLWGTSPTYDPAMGERKTSLTVTVDPRLIAYAKQLVQAGKAPDVSAVINDALSEKAGRDAAMLESRIVEFRFNVWSGAANVRRPLVHPRPRLVL